MRQGARSVERPCARADEAGLDFGGVFAGGRRPRCWTCRHAAISSRPPETCSHIYAGSTARGRGNRCRHNTTERSAEAINDRLSRAAALARLISIALMKFVSIMTLRKPPVFECQNVVKQTITAVLTISRRRGGLIAATQNRLGQGGVNWDDFRLVKAIAESRSLVGAAETLGLNHSTIFRRLGALEKRSARAVRAFPYRIRADCGRRRDGRLRRSHGQDVSEFERRIAGREKSPRGIAGQHNDQFV